MKNEPLKIAITGSSGMVGSALSRLLKAEGHEVIPIKRGPIPKDQIENIDAVINLAGKPIASFRWNKAKKQKVYDSRIEGTKRLVDTLNSLKHPPKVLISASAVGYYGNDEKASFIESQDPGKGFLASTCIDWEKEACKFKGRCVIPRIGMVLSSKGGALYKMLPIFRLGLGGVLGNGKQWISWIALDDLIQILYESILNESFKGPVNLCTPNPVTNYELTKTLGKVLQRPTILPVPSFILKVVFGEMADALLLSSCKVLPEKLQNYSFSYPTLEEALRHVLKKNPTP